MPGIVALAVSLVMIGPAAGGPPVVCVDADLVTGANDGSSWTDAFRGRLGLQAALSSIAPGASAELWIADGEYAPGASGGPRTVHFALRPGLALYGGFAGGESSRDERDPATNVAVLTGDLNGDDVPTSIWWNNASDNAANVVRILDGDASTVLDGVTVRRGSAMGVGAPNGEGGCVRIEGGAPIVRNCVVRDGEAEWGGGGLAVIGAAPLVEDCTFERNIGSDFGAAVHHAQGSTGRFERCRFVGNLGGLGAGIFNGSGAPRSDVTVLDCVFEGNRGPIGAASGIGVFDWGGVSRIERCRFIDNKTVAGGGGIYLHRSSTLVLNCDFVDNEGFADGGGAVFVSGGDRPGGEPAGPARVVGCRFVGNNGVAVCVFAPSVRFVNCTMAHNSLGDAFNTWPVFFAQGPDDDVVLENCIVWGNDPQFHPGLAGIFTTIVGGSFTVNGSCVQSWDGSLPGAGTFAADPRFRDALGADGVAGTEDDDLHLSSGSPCVEIGNDAAWPAGEMHDLDGLARFVDDDGDQLAQLDLGCFERGPNGPDLDSDGAVGFGDLLLLIAQWGPCGGCAADLDGDGMVGLSDLLVLLSAWS